MRYRYDMKLFEKAYIPGAIFLVSGIITVFLYSSSPGLAFVVGVIAIVSGYFFISGFKHNLKMARLQRESFIDPENVINKLQNDIRAMEYKMDIQMRTKRYDSNITKRSDLLLSRRVDQYNILIDRINRRLEKEQNER